MDTPVLIALIASGVSVVTAVFGAVLACNVGMAVRRLQSALDKLRADLTNGGAKGEVPAHGEVLHKEIFRIIWPFILVVVLLFAAFTLVLHYVTSTGASRFQGTGQFGDSYGLLNALFSGLAFSALLAALILQKRELNASLEEMRKSVEHQSEMAAAAVKQGKIAASIQMLELLGTSEAKEDRRRVASMNKPPGTLSDDEKRVVERASNSFERIALLLQEGVLPRELVFDMFAEPIVITWRKIGPHIVHERTSRYSRFQFRFEKMAADAELYLRENYPNHSIQVDADPS